MGQAGGIPCTALAHPLLFPGQRSREEQAAGKDGQQSLLGTDSGFSMEENSLYSSRGKGRQREAGKVQWSWVCLRRRQRVSRSISSPSPSRGASAGFAPRSRPCRSYVQAAWWKISQNSFFLLRGLAGPGFAALSGGFRVAGALEPLSAGRCFPAAPAAGSHEPHGTSLG